MVNWDCVVDVVNDRMSSSTTMQDSHRLFLQTFMSQGMLGVQEVIDNFQEACARYGGDCNRVNRLCS